MSTQLPFDERANLTPDCAREVLSEKTFTRGLCLERRRSERSQKQFLLMLLDASELLLDDGGPNDVALNNVLSAILNSTRETDISGWYEERCILGTILTEIPSGNISSAVNAVSAKVNAALLSSLSLSEVNKLRFSFHVYPEADHKNNSQGSRADLKLYPDLLGRDVTRLPSLLIKRAIDFAASLALLTLLWPLMAVIAALIKLTSRGPVLFRQDRVGQYGRPFLFLKFRSMYANSDSSVHREYVKQFISGAVVPHPGNGNDSVVYKLTDDPRITRFGRFLRKTSLDELPQLLNVLMGQMSLVGPRPPVPYEFSSYEPWHRRRLVEVKPGITGLWQVSGRSRTNFDEMVRLDLRYAKTWSLSIDLKILLQTPRAVFSAEGAY